VLKHWPVREMGFAIGIVTLLLLSYVGSYAALVTRDFDFRAKSVVVPKYRLGGEYSKRLYSLLHDIDLKIRPEYWTFHEFVKELWRNSPCLQMP
jgi:hypothetical protein